MTKNHLDKWHNGRPTAPQMLYNNIMFNTTPQMNNDTKALILIGLVILLFSVLFGISISHQKTECLTNGGKWVSGIIGGNYSAFCIPK